MKIGLSQINCTVGDIEGNLKKISQEIDRAKNNGCDVVVFPELILTGYPPEDLLLKPSFVEQNIKTLHSLAAHVKNIAVILGFVDQIKNQRYNAAALIQDGKLKSVYHKHQLPNYGVFDEIRYFTPGTKPAVWTIKGIRFGVTICEDIWIVPGALSGLKKLKPNVVLNISASPFHAGKFQSRIDVTKKAAKFLNTPVLYCNLVGGQDELVFDGGSFAVSAAGATVHQMPFFKEDLGVLEVGAAKSKLNLKASTPSEKPLAKTEEILSALVLGLHDYVEKNGFKQVAIGISGGIDSALVAALAVQALGPDRVIGVTMPSKYNISETRKDAETLAQNLGIKFISIPIQGIFETMLQSLAPTFEGTAPNIAEENVQARVRGNLLMALSNKFNWLVLTTGNKSEISTGYCTLYGDTAGGFAVLKDVLKTTVYELSRLINKKAGKDLIPQSILDRPPTAELRDNQKDEDSLGPYAELDPVIVGYVEQNLSLDELSKKLPVKKESIKRLISMIDRNEYKRRQAAPGIKITPRSFGRDHRMPITNRFRQA